MKLDKIVIVLLLTLGIGFSVFYFSDEAAKNVSDKDAGAIFLPGLMGKINQIGQIVITEKDQTTHLVLNDNRWVVTEKSGYDAEFSKVKSLLLGLAELKTVEPKTSKPENYARLGVQGVDKPGETKSTKIELLDKAGNLHYTLIVGKEKSARSLSSTPYIYVRQLNDSQSWLVSGKVTLTEMQTDWLNNKIIDISSDRIKMLEINRPGNNLFRMSKKEAADENFIIENFPVNATLKSEAAVNSVANNLERLTFDDVLSRGSFKADEADITTATFKTFDGLKVAAKLLEKDSKHYIWFDISSDSQDPTALSASRELSVKSALWVYEIQAFKAGKFKKVLSDFIQLSPLKE